MTVSATIYTLFDSVNGRNLALNITSNATRSELTFLTNGGVNFNGKNGTTIGSGSSGGNGGIVNITVPDLFNTTNAVFVGTGGYTTSSGAGGNGGTLQLNFRGLIRNFTNAEPYTPAPNLAGGGSVGLIFGDPGHLIYNQNLDKCPRDADVNGEGLIDLGDRLAVRNIYNKETGESGFITKRDITCNGRIDVIELAKVGFEWDTR
jgi:hypothetical protein